MSNKQNKKGKRGAKGNNKPQDNPIPREEEEPQQTTLQQVPTQEDNVHHQPEEKPETQETRPEEPKVETQTDKPPTEEQSPSQTLATESIEVSATSELARSTQSDPEVSSVQQQVSPSVVAVETREEQAVKVEAHEIVQEQVQTKVEQSLPVSSQPQQKHEQKYEVHTVPTHTTEFEVLTESLEAVIQPVQREEESCESTEVKVEVSKPETELVVHNQPQQELSKEEVAQLQQQVEIAQEICEVAAEQPVEVHVEPKIEFQVEDVPEPASQPCAVQPSQHVAQPQAEQHQAVVHEEVISTVIEVEPQRELEVHHQPQAVEAHQAHQVSKPEPQSKPEVVEPVAHSEEVKYQSTVINMNQPIDEVFFPKEEPKAPIQQPKEEERLFRLVQSQEITEVAVAESMEIPRVQEEVKIVVGDSQSFSDLNYSIEVGASQEQAEPPHKSNEQPLYPIQESNSALVEQAQEQQAVEQLVVSQPEPIKIEESSPNESILASQPVEILEEKVEQKVEEIVKIEEVRENEHEPVLVQAEPTVVNEEKQEIRIEESRHVQPEAAPSPQNLGIDSNIAQPKPEREIVMIESVVEQVEHVEREKEKLEAASAPPSPKSVGLQAASAPPSPKSVGLGLDLGKRPKQVKEQEKPKPSLLKKFLFPSAVGVAAGSALWLLRGKETGSSIAIGLAASALAYLFS